MPECSKVNLAFVIIKPNHIKMIEGIMDLFLQLKFKVAYKEKRIMNRAEAERFLESVIDDRELIETNKIKLLEYWQREIHIVGLVKPACRKELLSILSELIYIFFKKNI